MTAAAGRAHVRAGMTVAGARAMCAALEVEPWDDVALGAELTRVTAALLMASPQVTPAAGAPGTWWVGAGGFEARGGEAALAHALSEIARRWHPAARVAVADSCVAARAATWSQRPGGGATSGRARAPWILIPPGHDATYLAPAPLGLLPMDEELRETLQALGIRSAGGLAALAAEEVERRWGDVGLAAWRLARGVDPRRPVLARPEAPRSVTAELPVPAETMEPLLFLVRAALDRLVRDLVTDGRAAAAVAVTLAEGPADASGRARAPGADDPDGARGRRHTITREIRPARPLARVAPLFERCRALLEGWTLGAPVEAVTVAVTATAPLAGEQGELLDAAWRDPGAIEAAFARLRSELGADAVVRPVARDEHRPERAGAWLAVGDDVDARPEGAAAAVEATDRGAGSEVDDSGTGGEVGGVAETGARRRVRAQAKAGAKAGAGAPPDTTIALFPSRSTIVSPHPASHLRPSLAPAAPSALRLLETPEPVDVDGTLPTGAPRAMWWRGRRIPIARATGPERLAGDWWRAPYTRDYWRCESADTDAGGGADFVLYRQRGPSPRDGHSSGAGRWFLQGWYD